MGNVTSRSQTVSNPSLFATPLKPAHVDDVEDKHSWWTYDYVIVGGGTAGCVLASRLSEDPEVSVLLIEAGKTHEGHFLSHLPLGFSQMFKSAYDWAYHTVPQKYLNNRSIYWPRGKILGGSSAINALIYHHCAPEDYDEWERLGAEGWGYETMKKYFDKAENYAPHPMFPEVDSLRGTGKRREGGRTSGPWKVSHTEVAPITMKMLDACETVGIPRSHDLNTPEGTLGAAAWVGTIDRETATRSSTATAYLTPQVLARPNLTVATNVLVEKILFSSESGTSNLSNSSGPDTSPPNPKAIGVQLLPASPPSPSITQFTHNQTQRKIQRYRAGARTSVILCAGAIATPQILMLSGVGPREEVEGVGVRVVRELEWVGRNLLDHYSAGPLVFRAKPGTTWDWILTPWGALFALLWYFIAGGGPLACLGSQAGVFVRGDDQRLPLSGNASKNLETKDLSSGPHAPDLEFIFVPFIGLDHGFRKAPWGSSGVTFGSLLLRPESQGRITLKSNSIFDPPVIDANYLSTSHDINMLVKVTRLIMRIARSEPVVGMLDLKDLPDVDEGDEALDGDDSGKYKEKEEEDGERGREEDFFWPGDADPDKITDSALKAWIRRNGHSSWHPTSTAKIGRTPLEGVVDPALRVHGVDNLRIVDASVFPSMVSGHPCAAIVAIAERAADLLKDDREYIV